MIPAPSSYLKLWPQRVLTANQIVDSAAAIVGTNEAND